MKTATVEDLRDHFSEVSQWIEAGEAVEILRQGEVFATLSPVAKKPPFTPWPDLAERLRKTFPDGPPGGSTAEELIDYLRGEY